MNTMENLVIDAVRVRKTLMHENESVRNDADNLGKAMCAKIFSMCFGASWIPAHNGRPSGIVQSPAMEPPRLTEVHVLAAYLHRPTRNLKLHRMMKALRERDDDDFYNTNRAFIETKIRDWTEMAEEKIRIISEKNDANSTQNYQTTRNFASQESENRDLFDDDDDFEEVLGEDLQLSKIDQELQIYNNLSRDKYLQWRSAQPVPEYNTESHYFRLFWKDHQIHMPSLSRIAHKVSFYILQALTLFLDWTIVIFVKRGRTTFFLLILPDGTDLRESESSSY
jgi:hypothetical protein